MQDSERYGKNISNGAQKICFDRFHVAWKKLLSWMTRSRLEPVVKVARTIRQYPWGIVNATRLGATNAKSESAKAMIQKLKARACGFRNRSRFKMAILFHLGGLSLLPDGLT
jgi:transposase